jgi:cbb3-type cytochrome oxidase maturation protein
MSIIWILIPLAIVIAGIAVAAFARAAHTGQFDDLESPAHRMLHDDEDDA